MSQRLVLARVCGPEIARSASSAETISKIKSPTTNLSPTSPSITIPSESFVSSTASTHDTKPSYPTDTAAIGPSLAASFGVTAAAAGIMQLTVTTAAQATAITQFIFFFIKIIILSFFRPVCLQSFPKSQIVP